MPFLCSWEAARGNIDVGQPWEDVQWPETLRQAERRLQGQKMDAHTPSPLARLPSPRLWPWECWVCQSLQGHWDSKAKVK